jgi:hypothetical protein
LTSPHQRRRRGGRPFRAAAASIRLASGTITRVSFTMPEFPEPTAIDETRSWTATYDSYDQRHDVSYYMVTIHEGGHPVGRIVVEVFMFPAGDDWTTAEFVPYMREQIHQIAVEGTSNTDYRGYYRRLDDT